MRETLIRVDTGWCVAGVVFDRNGKMVACAPILKKYTSGCTKKWFVKQCRAHGWEVKRMLIRKGPGRKK